MKECLFFLQIYGINNCVIIMLKYCFWNYPGILKKTWTNFTLFLYTFLYFEFSAHIIWFVSLSVIRSKHVFSHFHLQTIPAATKESKDICFLRDNSGLSLHRTLLMGPADKPKHNIVFIYVCFSNVGDRFELLTRESW